MAQLHHGLDQSDRAVGCSYLVGNGQIDEMWVEADVIDVTSGLSQRRQEDTGGNGTSDHQGEQVQGSAFLKLQVLCFDYEPNPKVGLSHPVGLLPGWANGYFACLLGNKGLL